MINERFSTRIGITDSVKQIQIDSMDKELRNRLWNVYSELIFNGLKSFDSLNKKYIILDKYFNSLWHNYFKKPVDDIDKFVSVNYNDIKKYFFNASWYNIYEFLEFSIIFISNHENKFQGFLSDVIIEVNRVLTEEYSGFRLTNGVFCPITNDFEIKSVNDTFEYFKKGLKLQIVNKHFGEAICLISKKPEADYRNSIKESISAIEALCRVFLSSDKSVLSDSLKIMASKNMFDIYPTILSSIDKLYSFSSTVARHAEVSDYCCKFEDAQFMLISCSSIINYLIIKATNSGFNFE